MSPPSLAVQAQPDYQKSIVWREVTYIRVAHPAAPAALTDPHK